ncbi:MAG: hypothetical protein Q9177_000481 [Variospora cf. flavescens]
MTEPEELDEDLFADLYDADEPAASAPAQAQSTSAQEPPEATVPIPTRPPPDSVQEDGGNEEIIHMAENHNDHLNGQDEMDESKWDNGGRGSRMDVAAEQDSGGIGIKEDGLLLFTLAGSPEMRLGENAATPSEHYGPVQECTVMRDGATGRSRGFGFLTFRDPKTVNVVMVKEHYLDGKIIDPKRAIPRDEQERTSKIFVGGVSQEATETDFKEYFMQFGRVVDATLMMDKDTGRPRGFGFVTFDSEAAVDNTFNGDLMILGKPIEVKKAQPRGNMREDDESFGGRRGGRRGGKDFRDDRGNYDNNSGANQNQNQNPQNGQGTFAAGMTPQMMAQYWTKMQQYMATFMQQQAANQMAGGMGMGGMNPAMMQQMAQMQQMQKMQQQMASQQQGSQSPMPQSPGAQGMGGMTPAMMQQMQQMQQMQAMQQGGGGFGGPMVSPMPANTPPGGGGAGGAGGFGGRRSTPGYNAQDQLAFEQQKYEQQQARRAAQEVQQMQYQHGGPTSWEGMYDDVPQPNMNQHGGGMGRGGRGGRGGGFGGHQQQQQPTPGPQSAPPANAPTGPKNAGKPGANYRGGGHRGAHRGFHPYSRN